MGGTKSEAVVKKSGVDDGSIFRPFQEIPQVTQMSVTTSDSIPRTVLIQDKHLPRAEPSLRNTSTRHTVYYFASTEEEQPAAVRVITSRNELTRQQKVSLSLWSNVSRCIISKSEAWSKLQGLAEINSSMPCF